MPRHENHASALAAFVGVTNFGSFPRTNGVEDGSIVLFSPEYRASFPFEELIVSWNATAPAGSGLKIEARAFGSNHGTPFYTMGLWAPDTAYRPRESVTGQRDEEGDVKTDTLVLRQPAERMQLRLTLFPDEKGELPTLKFVGLCFSRRRPPGEATDPGDATAGASLLAVPERAQLAYPGGRDWCSPTCVSMVLGYWARKLNRPELEVGVPEVAAGVFDRNWPGTGNWPFNCAFAGQFAGMRGYVTRLHDSSELDLLLDAGVPPILSVSFDLLNGKPADQGTGHLAVCVGRNEGGDFVLNDPWAFGDKAGAVRRIVSRHDLERAWARSQNTVYLIHPEKALLPRSRWSAW